MGDGGQHRGGWRIWRTWDSADGLGVPGGGLISLLSESHRQCGTLLTAEIEAGNPGIGKLTWVRWRYEATLPKAGAYSVVVRATDGTGAIQDGIQTDPLPSGSTGWHRRLIVAR